MFSCKIFVLKYFRGLWQPTIIKHTKCILYTNICAFNFVVRLPHENILTTNISQTTVFILAFWQLNQVTVWICIPQKTCLCSEKWGANWCAAVRFWVAPICLASTWVSDQSSNCCQQWGHHPLPHLPHLQSKRVYQSASTSSQRRTARFQLTFNVHGLCLFHHRTEPWCIITFLWYQLDRRRHFCILLWQWMIASYFCARLADQARRAMSWPIGGVQKEILQGFLIKKVGSRGGVHPLWYYSSPWSLSKHNSK